MLRRSYIFAVGVSLALFFCGTSWLLGPHVNHTLLRGPNLISEYEAAGMPYGTWFRLFDAVAAVLVLLVTFVRRRTIDARFHRWLPGALYGIAGLQIIDAVTPVACTVRQGICAPRTTPIGVMHGIESVLLVVATIGISAYVTYRVRKYVWLPGAILLCSLSSVLLHNHLGAIPFGLQIAALLLSWCILWYVLLGDIFARQPAAPVASIAARSIACAVAINSAVGVLDVVLHISRHTHLHSLTFVGNTAWPSQHLMIVSLTILYLARALWQGSTNAWRVVTLLCFVEVVSSAAFGHVYARTAIYLFLFVLLVISRNAFTFTHGFARFRRRLLHAALVVGITLCAVTILSVTFHYFSTRQWDRSAFTPDRVIARTLLLEVSSDPSDPLKARLFGQVLTSAGIFMYSWIFLGLFLPAVIRQSRGSSFDRERMRQLLRHYANSSEDYFKLWPADKQYWFSADCTAAVAYRQSGSFVIALADPITAQSGIPASLQAFHDFARAHGTKAAWLMVDKARLHYYQRQGYTTLQIGASAVVPIRTFVEQTVTNKWWRWKRNKASKQGLYYETLQPPHSTATLDAMAKVSDAWLTKEGHTERTFALGYFDRAELRMQLLHVLRDQSGRIVAFANQLPSERTLDYVTIDLMRSLPEAAEAMAYLLSEIIITLSKTSDYTYFDLGFVPLAHTSQSGYRTAVLGAIKQMLKPVFSSRGLEQFKNKFDPEWRAYYLAYDGDYLDAVKLLNELNKVMRLEQ